MKIWHQKYLIVILCFLLPGDSYAEIKDTVHNLSTSGSGSIRANSEDRICIFCHTPHNALPSGPLWNRDTPGFSFDPYSSSTAVASPGQPTGSSLLCLSCHDGTIALGKIANPNTTISMAGSTTMPSGNTLIGTDLTDDHPISFQYTNSLANNNGELVHPGSLTGPIKLDANGELQCTSCHDPHNNDLGKFQIMSNKGGALCTTCHQKHNWEQTPHNTSTASWDGINTNPWSDTDWDNVADNACQNCHQPHKANHSERLLKHTAEEDNCRACHNGHVAQKNIMDEFNKFSNHPIIDSEGVHDPTEAAVVDSRHVECVDCHNPHAARSTGTPAGPISGTRGVDSSGNEINPISQEYQLCYRCHADSSDNPAGNTPRVIAESNVRLEFDTSNPSYHPVEGTGRNPNVISLIAPLTTNSIIKCSDCHNNNQGPGANGVGPNGPHGSDFSPLLERQYVTSDPNPYSEGDYALCFKCHDPAVLLSFDSGFPLHKKHVIDQSAPCNVCHDPHGVRSPPGTSTNNTHLINFDTSVVTARGGWGGGTQPVFTDTGTSQGNCNLSCHGRDHWFYSYYPWSWYEPLQAPAPTDQDRSQ